MRWIVDDEPSSRFPVYTRGNVGEVFPDVVSPLTWSSFGWEAEQGWRDAYRALGTVARGDFPDGQEKVLVGVFGGYAYLNLSYTRVLAVRTPGLDVEAIDRQIFGASEAPPYEPRRGDKNLMASVRTLWTVLRTLRTRDLAALRADRAMIEGWLRTLPPPDLASDAQLLQLIDDCRPLFRRLFTRHILVSTQAGIGPGLLAQICADRLDDPALALTLQAGIGDVDSAAPAFAMWDLGRAAAADAALSSAFEAGPTALATRLGDFPEFGAAFDGFLAKFGSRGPNEWEASLPTWGTEPGLALAAIDRMRVADPDHDPRVRRAELERRRREATAAARARLRGMARRNFDMAVRASHVFAQGRERTKTTIVRALHGLRAALSAFASRVAARGGTDEPADLALLTHAELPDYVAAPAGFAGVVAGRREMRDRLSALVPPFVFSGAQPAVETWATRAAPLEIAAAGVHLTGIAGCPGVARGRARVVLDPHDPRGLGPGDVLVAPITDPSWTPLFVPAEAVVVDVGATLSHAVIVARELGIPAVVSVTDATRRIADGTLLEVDGDQGIVRVLDG